MTNMRYFVLIFIISIVTYCQAQTIEECLQKDSISCVQRSLFKRAKEFFDKESFELLSGISLVKSKDDRAGRSGDVVVYEQEIDKAKGIAERQSALENYIGEEISNFFKGRSLRINFAPMIEKIGESARAFSDSIPAEVKQVANDVAEGRGKKKLMKTLMPILLLIKVKLVTLATFAYFGITLIAKKAIVVSLISIAISAFIALKSFMSKSSHETAYAGWSSSAPLSSGWASPAIVSSGGPWASGGSGWDDTHGAFSAQNQAYSAYHH